MRSRYQLLAAAALVLWSGLHCETQVDAAKGDTFWIPRAGAISVDGVLSPAEWDRAVRAEIMVAKDWVVAVYAQHDDKNLYLAFTNLKRGTQERYPEVMLDPSNEKTLFWRPGQWWLHASYNLCESNGRPSEFSNCRPAQEGWNANRFPVRDVSEFAISLNKVGLSAHKNFGIGFDVTDTHGEWGFWPASAKIKIPMSWQKAQLQ